MGQDLKIKGINITSMKELKRTIKKQTEDIKNLKKRIRRQRWMNVFLLWTK